MEEKDKPAYPIYDPEFVRHDDIATGLTKREYFAAAALQGILAAATNTGYLREKEACERALRNADMLIELLNTKD